MHIGDDDHQSRHGADDNGIDEGLQQSDQSFGNRFLGFGRRMGNRRRSNPGFIGKAGAAQALHQHTNKTARNPDGGKGPGDDRPEGGRNMADIHR
ncbi:hypothetical protein JCM17846_05810 [Iodidimonas nitroreducens]|uniref:Uncharacterized protein n=1 Tax=Iodidimonas nitroreducens TaxID=1236968 RepID=A0A5A7N746_9PROT|nr:hypothetical protein JCM17846_05810 [Iodidimonas nitroreducens]